MKLHFNFISTRSKPTSIIITRLLIIPCTNLEVSKLISSFLGGHHTDVITKVVLFKELLRKILQISESKESACTATGGQLTPYAATELTDYPNDLDRKIATLLLSADTVRFDGSDVQPSAVGAGSFWTEITEYVIGDQDLSTTVARIDDDWPTN